MPWTRVQHDIAINYTNSRRSKQRNQPFHRREQHRPNTKNFGSSNNKSCILCKSAGRNHQGHDIAACHFLSQFEKLKIANALAVEVSDDTPQELEHFESDQFLVAPESSVQKVHHQVVEVVVINENHLLRNEAKEKVHHLKINWRKH